MEIDKSRYFSILSQIKEEDRQINKYGEHYLLVDGHNLIMRTFMANPTLNDNGEHVGAIIGSFKSFGAAVKMLKPTKVLVIFDGKGGSKKRKELYPDYKGKRAVRMRVNRVYTDMVTPDSEDESVRRQLSRVIQYFECFPIKVLAIENIEADDTIAYCSQQLLPKDRITIMSTDRDFLQLVDERVKVWSPTKGKLYGPEELKKEYEFSSTNFINYRIMDGDKGDNIPGVKGAGPKTILKNFPMLKEDKFVTVDELIKHAGYNVSNGKFYGKILENKELLELNFKLMQLKEVDILPSTKLKIMDILNSPINQLNKLQFMKMLAHDRIENSIPQFNVWVSETCALLEMTARSFNHDLKK